MKEPEAQTIVTCNSIDYKNHDSRTQYGQNIKQEIRNRIHSRKDLNLQKIK